MKNQMYQHGSPLRVTVPVGTVSGDPIVIGQLPGVAMTDRDANGKSNCALDGVYDLSVRGIDGGGNVAVAEGDIIYHVNADTPKLSKKNTGVRFGIALGAVSSGATTTIPVRVGY